MACWWRPMAARSVCRRPYAATMRRSPETGGHSRRRRDGLFAKEHGGETTKLSGSSRERPRLPSRSRLLANIRAQRRCGQARYNPSAAEAALEDVMSTALRSLRSTPGVTAFILVILTLTIAAATVTFSVVDAV